MRERTKKLIVNVVTIGLSLLIGFAFSEVGYRVYLYLENPNKMLFGQSMEHPTFGLYDVSHWEYDEKLGFTYPPGREIQFTMIENGRVVQCNEIRTINERGNIGEIRGDYDTADLKILVFGDSFPAFYVGGSTFPMKLQDVLTERLGKSVHVVNFGRDGTGVLQIFDTAAAKTREWAPDLAVITFTTDDLDRVRIWRTVTTINGEERVLTTDRADPNPGIERGQDTFVLNRRASHEWCHKMLAQTKGSGPSAHDPADNAILRHLVFKYRRMARESG